MKTATPRLSVFTANKEKTDYLIDGEISEVALNGEKLLEIHEVALRCEKLAKSVKILTATTLFSFAVITGFWLHYLSGKKVLLTDFENLISEVQDTNSRVTYMIDVRPGSREAQPYLDWVSGYPVVKK